MSAALAAAAEKIGRALRFVGRPPLRHRQNRIGVGGDQCAVWLEFIEGAAFGKRFDGALVQCLGIDAACKIGERVQMGRWLRAR